MKAILRITLWATLFTLSLRVSAAPDQVTISYIQAITTAVNASVRRPIVEMDPNETGIVVVSFDCTDNVVSNLKIDASSPHRAFDLAALQAVKSAKFPTVPSELIHKTVHVSVEVHIPAMQ